MEDLEPKYEWIKTYSTVFFGDKFHKSQQLFCSPEALGTKVLSAVRQLGSHWWPAGGNPELDLELVDL